MVHLLATLKNQGDLPASAREAISVGQRREHIGCLRRLREMPAELWSLPVDRAVVEVLERQRAKGKWRETTWAKAVGCAAGALSRITEYAAGSCNLRLSDSPLWRDVMRQAAKKKTAQVKCQAEAASLEDVRKTVQRLQASQDPAAKQRAAQLAIMWLTCARPGCILQLKGRDVHLSAQNLQVVFVRGKAHELGKGPLPVSSRVPAEWTGCIEAALKTPADRFIWQFPSLTARILAVKALSADLRETRRELQARSVRRGALQALAAAGVSEADILAFSGHSTVEVLRDYIGMTEATKERTNRMRRGAAHLIGGLSPA